MRTVLRFGSAVAALGLIASCATNPATGRREFSLVSESQEIQMGQQGSAEVVQSVGLVQDQALQAYVKNLGNTLAARSERPQLPWEFYVLDDAAVNAFAMPGGFIFVTRGILSHMNDEAELVSVLGHEIAHVTARHSAQQITSAQLAQLGLGIGSILSPTVARIGQVASAGLGLLFLKFGRDDETQADRLGFGYTLGAGYDVREMADVFEMLQRQSQLGGGGRLPEWQSTHPDPGSRIQATQQRVSAVKEDLNSKKIGADEFLNRINGLTFGENPRHGYFEKNLFVHPDLAFRLQFPTGWKTQNQPQAVVGASSSGDAMMELSFAQGNAATASQAFFSQQGIQASSTSRGNIHGFPAVTGEFAAQTQDGVLRGLATFIEYGNRTYRLLAYTTQERYNSYTTVFQQSHGSFDRLTDAVALAAQPERIRVERLPRAMTLAQFHQQYPSSITLQELAIMNGMSETEQLRSGQLVKRVTK